MIYRILLITFSFFHTWSMGCSGEQKAVPKDENGSEPPDGTDTCTDSNRGPWDAGMQNDTDIDDGGLGECFDGGLTFEPALSTELDESWSPDGPYWKLVYLPIERMEIVKSPPLHDKAAVRILLETTLPNDCLRLTSAMIWTQPEYPRVIFPVLRAWRTEQSECATTSRKEKRIIALTPEAGCWTAKDPVGGGRITFDVSRCEDVEEDCGCNENLLSGELQEGETCKLDCQCAGYGSMCLPLSESQRVCGEPCSLDNDCWAGECRFESKDGPGICRSFTTDECTEDKDCAETEMCLEYYGINFCRTDVALNGTTRHECSSNDDCETPNLVCALDNSSKGTGKGKCNLPCETSLSVCPGMHSCDKVITGTTAVCEWGGK